VLVELELAEVDVAVDLHLGPEQEVSGRVVLADGEPAAGLRVRLHPVEPDFVPTLQATTAADGAFAVRGSLEGGYHLMIDRDGSPAGPRRSRAGTLAFTTELHVTGGEVELPPVMLEPAPP
jgi:hypothetical protein